MYGDARTTVGASLYRLARLGLMAGLVVAVCALLGLIGQHVLRTTGELDQPTSLRLGIEIAVALLCLAVCIAAILFLSRRWQINDRPDSAF